MGDLQVYFLYKSNIYVKQNNISFAKYFVSLAVFIWEGYEDISRFVSNDPDD